MTFSIGVACLQSAANMPLETLVRAADAALYRAKQLGRACFELAV